MDEVPAAFHDVLAGLEEQPYSTSPADPFHRCFGCGPGHPSGLRVRCFKTPEGVLAPVVVPRVYAGPPNTAHGGIVAAYLDEILGGAAIWATGKASVTGELTVRYLMPTPVETPLLGRGRLVANHDRYVEVEGSLEELGKSARVVATARGLFFPIRGN
jgi:acyl-coenzyme A thioesterase PaaI-like protein